MKEYRVIIPTIKTALFVLTANDIEECKQIANFILYESKLIKEAILNVEKVP